MNRRCSILIAAISMTSIFDALAAARSWKEEVQFQDGRKAIVARTVERGGRHEIGQEPPYRRQGFTFTMPGTNEEILWEDNYSEDLGTASFLPMQLEVRGRHAYLVAVPTGCLSFNKWGRPNPPYVALYETYTQPEHKSIVRAPIPGGDPNSCPELVFYKGAWVGPGDSIGKRMLDRKSK
jgi:hypothetical protein